MLLMRSLMLRIGIRRSFIMSDALWIEGVRRMREVNGGTGVWDILVNLLRHGIQMRRL